MIGVAGTAVEGADIQQRLAAAAPGDEEKVLAVWQEARMAVAGLAGPERREAPRHPTSVRDYRERGVGVGGEDDDTPRAPAPALAIPRIAHADCGTPDNRDFLQAVVDEEPDELGVR